MPRKAAAAISDDAPRRSSRIKEQPKPVEPVKKVVKPKVKKADKEGGDEYEQPKAARGKKRKVEETNGADDEAAVEKPASKKVCFPFPYFLRCRSPPL